MNRNVLVVFILTAALWTTAAHAGQPVITSGLTGGTLREMDVLLFSLQASDPAGHPLESVWSITSDETGGQAFLQNSAHLSTEFAVRWISASAAGQLNGKKVEVQVIVRHVNSTDGTEQAVSKATYTVQGVNHPPVPVISGRLGTPTERIPTGWGICADAYKSSDPEGDGVRGNWDWGARSGGRWKTALGDFAPALIGSEGGRCCFSVLDMTAPIDQEMVLTLVDGLHNVKATATCYMKPASGTVTPTNSAPTITIPSPPGNPVNVLVGSAAQLVAEVEDPDGDALSYSFVFLQNNSTVASSAVSVVPLTGNKKRVTATVNHPTAGTYQYRFTARESSTTDHKSAVANITLVVGTSSTPGDGGPGDVDDTPEACTDSNSAAPPSITVTPPPLPTKPLFQSGNVATISVSSSDPDERPSSLMPGKIERGVTITWNLSELTALGAQPNVSTTVRAGDPKTSDSVLTFTVPPLTIVKDVYLTVFSTDIYQCRHTYRFAIRLEPGSSTGNQAPVAKIQYKVGLANYENAPATPVTVQTDAAKTITLKADTSTDDGGTANLAYTWVKVDSISSGGVTLSSNSGPTTTLQVLAHTSGTVNVTLTAKDKGNLTGTATISFNIADPAQKPTAIATAKVGGQALTGPVAEGTVVTLDGSESKRANGEKTNLTYQWSQTAGPDVTITDADKAVAQFTAPVASEAGSQLKFELIVLDGGTPSDPVELTINLSVGSFYFSQVAVGPLGASQFLRTVLVLVNQNTTPATGVEVKFYGQNGNPLDVTIDEEPWDSAPFDIPALGSRRLVFSGQDLKSGWAQVNSSLKITGLLHYQVVGVDKNLESEVGLYSTEAATKFATFYDPTEETAIAVANPMAQPAKVRIRLQNDTGDEVVSKYLFIEEPNSSLPAMHHKAQFVNEALLGKLSPDFTLGTLIIESDVAVTITVVKTRGGVVFSTLPVASMK